MFLLHLLLQAFHYAYHIPLFTLGAFSIPLLQLGSSHPHLMYMAFALIYYWQPQIVRILLVLHLSGTSYILATEPEAVMNDLVAILSLEPAGDWLEQFRRA